MKRYIKSGLSIKDQYSSRIVTSTNLNIDIDVDIAFSEDVLCAKQGMTLERAEYRSAIFNKVSDRLVTIIENEPTKFTLLRCDRSMSSLTRKSNKEQSSTYSIHSNSRYYTLVSKIECGFVMNKWGISMRLSDHTENHPDNRTQQARAVLDGDNPYNYKFPLENSDGIKNINIKFASNCNAPNESFNLQTTNGNYNVARGFSSLDTKLDKYLRACLTRCWNDVYNSCTEFNYRGYIIHLVGEKFYAENLAGYDSDSCATTAITLKSIIDGQLGEMSQSEHKIYGDTTLYSAYNSNSTHTQHALESMADDVVKILNSMCLNGSMWFKWTDIYFQCDYTLISIDVIDGDFKRTTADAVIEDADLLVNPECREEYVDYLVEDILRNYLESDCFEWDD